MFGNFAKVWVQVETTLLLNAPKEKQNKKA
jgi:hypothetical protein